MGNPIWVEYLRAVYLVWGMVGVLVALNYGRNAQADWRAAGGSWLHVPAEWIAITWFVVHGCSLDVWHLIRHRALPPVPPSFAGWGYSPGHLLRFFIMLSFVSAAIFGFMLVRVDRTHWPLSLLLPTAIAVTSSSVAGLGHLFIAWRFHARRWRWTVASTVLYVPIAMSIDHWLV